MALTIVAVVLLGMVLVVYNEYNTTPPMPQISSTQSPIPSSTPENSESPDVLSTSEAKPTEAKTVDQDVNEEKKAEPMEQATLTPPAEEAKSWGSNAPLAPATPSPTTQESEYRHPALSPPDVEALLEENNTLASEEKAPEKEAGGDTKPVEHASKQEQPKQEVAKPTSPKSSQSTTKEIKKITIATIGDGVTVRIDSLQTPDYTYLRLNSPERIVLDFEGNWKVKAPGVPKNEFVSNVRIGEQKKGTRIVIDLKKAPASVRYLKYGETGLDVRIR